MAAPTINFNAFLEKEKLKNNGSNFADWFRNLRIVLTAGNLTYVLDAPLGDPPAADATDVVKNVYLIGRISTPQFSVLSCMVWNRSFRKGLRTMTHMILSVNSN